MTALPPNHPQRIELNNEVHARPPERLVPPCRISYLALLADGEGREASWRAVAELAQAHDIAPPPQGANHFSADFGAFRLKWERHNEFFRCMFIVPDSGPDPFDAPAIAAVPAGWVASLPGELIEAAHLALLPRPDPMPHRREIADSYFAGNVLIGSAVSGQTAVVYTDFLIHADGFSRFLMYDRGTAPWQAGRIVQRVLELDTYRLLATMALPVARSLAPLLERAGQELGDTAAALVDASEADEPVLLDRLTRLSAEIDREQARTRFRLSAAEAYDDLVRRRILELREERIEGMQTFAEFVERRLAPAMQTCRSVSSRLESLSARASRATLLLTARVDVTREQQTHRLLEAMDRRVKLQLRLQSAVEGLSVAAITYYIASLVGRAAHAAEAYGWHIDPAIAEGVSIPFIAVALALEVRHIRRKIARSA